MPIDAKSLAEYFSGDRKGGSGNRDGFISPPLSTGRSKNGNGTFKRIAIVGFLILTILYFCGFSLPGLPRNRNKVVIILAANLGGGYPSLPSEVADDRCTGCQGVSRLGYGEVEYS